MNGRKWTAEEDAYLKKGWHQSEKVDPIANHLDRSITAVVARVEHLKIVKWSTSEINYLVSFWTSRSAFEISKEIHQPVSAIQQKAFELKLRGGVRTEPLRRRTKEYIVCDNCGWEFYGKRRNQISPTRYFCSKSCANHYWGSKKNKESLQSPNKPEIALDSLLQANFPSEYLFNGNYSQGVILGGLVPDFINVNGRKSVIELFGDYWHDKKGNIPWKSTEFGRQAVFSQLGYKSLIIWEQELKEPEVAIEKIRSFHEAGNR